MIKIITTVGTSLYENFLKTNNSIKDAYETLKEIRYSKISDYKAEVELIKNELSNIIINNIDACAESRTIKKITEEYKENKDFTAYLLSTDTILSYCAAELIKEQTKIENVTFSQIIRIEGLQIKDEDEFMDKGFSNLINEIKNIIKGNRENSKFILNISGGYKALIPLLAILGQLYSIELAYIYEESSELLSFSKLPIHFDWGIAEHFYPFLEMITKGEAYRIPKEVNNELVEQKLLKKNRKLTPLGKILKKYIESEMPLANSTLGFFVEFKLFEHFINNNVELDGKTFTNVKHSEKIEFNSEKREIDLIFKTDDPNEKFIVAECKSYLQILSDNSYEKFKIQYEGQLEILANLNPTIHKYYLIIYSSNSIKFDILYGKLNELKNMLEMKITECELEVYYLKINLELKDRNYYSNPYQKFLSQKSIYLKKININQE